MAEVKEAKYKRFNGTDWDEIKFPPAAHTHTKANITDFPTSMPASDVYSWAKASSKPSYNFVEVGAAPAIDTWRTNLGDPSIYELGVFDSEFTNKTDFFPRDKMIVETSSDGDNWSTTTEFTDAQIRRLVGGDEEGSLLIPNTGTNTTGYKRITFENNGYVYINAIYLYGTRVSGSLQCKIEKYSNDSKTWVTHKDYSDILGWPSHSVIRVGTIPWSASGAGQFSKIRLSFKGTTTNASYKNHSIYRIQLWGGYPAGKRNIYSIDYSKNFTFPAGVSATSFTENGTALSNKYQAKGNYLTSHQDISGKQNVINANNKLSYAFIDSANSLDEGTSDVTDNTELFTSYASNNGFADSNAVGKVYRRDAIKVYNYIKGKLDSVYQPKGTYLTSHQSLANYYTKTEVDTAISNAITNVLSTAV